jgi:hypothetical protein
MRWAIAGLVALAAVLSGCGTLEVIPSGAERVIHQLELSRAHVSVTNVSCPSGIDAKVGLTFYCHFLAPGGAKYTARMRIVKVQGTSVGYEIASYPS